MGALGVEIVWLESGHGKLEEGSQHTAEPTDRLSHLVRSGSWEAKPDAVDRLRKAANRLEAVAIRLEKAAKSGTRCPTSCQASRRARVPQRFQ
jgi:hypothetical protein